MTCAHEHYVSISGKVDDRFSMTEVSATQARQYEGYVPHNFGIGGGDYVRFSKCLICGELMMLQQPYTNPLEVFEELVE